MLASNCVHLAQNKALSREGHWVLGMHTQVSSCSCSCAPQVLQVLPDSTELYSWCLLNVTQHT